VKKKRLRKEKFNLDYLLEKSVDDMNLEESSCLISFCLNDEFNPGIEKNELEKLALEEDKLDNPGPCWEERLNDLKLHILGRIKYKQLIDSNDPSVASISNDDYVAVHPIKGIIFSGPNWKSLKKEYGTNFSYLKSPKSKMYHEKVAGSFLNSQIDSSQRQWITVNVKKKNVNDDGLLLDLCIDPGAMDTHVPIKTISELNLKIKQKIEVIVAGGGIVETHSYYAYVTLDGLRSDLIVLAGDTLLGIDVYSRYNSTWDWERNPVVEMTRRNNQEDE